MNNLLKLFLELNEKAFENVKRAEYAIGAYIYNKKTEAIIDKYSIYEKAGKMKVIREDVKSKINLDEVPVLDYNEYPSEADLNRYLRANFGEKYPRYIEVHHTENDTILVFGLEAITSEYIHKDFYVNLSNSKGEFYAYKLGQLRTME